MLPSKVSASPVSRVRLRCGIVLPWHLTSSCGSRPFHPCTLLNVRRDEVAGFVEFHPLIDLNCGSCGQRSGGRFTAKHSSKRSRTNHSRSKNTISNLIAVSDAWLRYITILLRSTACFLAHRASARALFIAKHIARGNGAILATHCDGFNFHHLICDGAPS